jgi:hypothetical protein
MDLKDSRLIPADERTLNTEFGHQHQPSKMVVCLQQGFCWLHFIRSRAVLAHIGSM